MQGVSKFRYRGRLSTLEGQQSDKEIVKKKIGQVGGLAFSEATRFGILNCNFYRFWLRMMIKKTP